MALPAPGGRAGPRSGDARGRPPAAPRERSMAAMWTSGSRRSPSASASALTSRSTACSSGPVEAGGEDLEHRAQAPGGDAHRVHALDVVGSSTPSAGSRARARAGDDPRAASVKRLDGIDLDVDAPWPSRPDQPSRELQDDTLALPAVADRAAGSRKRARSPGGRGSRPAGGGRGPGRASGVRGHLVGGERAPAAALRPRRAPAGSRSAPDERGAGRRRCRRAPARRSARGAQAAKAARPGPDGLELRRPSAGPPRRWWSVREPDPRRRERDHRTPPPRADRDLRGAAADVDDRDAPGVSRAASASRPGNASRASWSAVEDLGPDPGALVDGGGQVGAVGARTRIAAVATTATDRAPARPRATSLLGHHAATSSILAARIAPARAGA